MGIFTVFDGWINQNIQQRLKAEPTRSEDVKPSSVSKKGLIIEPPFYWDPSVGPKEKTEIMEEHVYRNMPVFGTDPKYYDSVEVVKQAELWLDTNKQHPWYDAPAKVKVKTKNGLCHLNIEFNLGWPPQAVYEMFNDPRNYLYFKKMDGRRSQTRLETKLTKVLKKEGPRQITEVEKVYRWKLLGYSGFIPMQLTMDENHQKLTGQYKKKKMKYMKVFEGSWKVEPLYADQERLCKSRSRISEQEYKKCSGGKGRVGSKVTMEQIFQPSSFLNVPPVSWLVRGITIKSTKALLEDLRKFVIEQHNLEIAR